jgi:hypothetical protein
VEQYLFQNGVAGAFYSNVATLPLTAQSVFIRPGGRGIVLCPIQRFLGVFNTSGIGSYQQANTCG